MILIIVQFYILKAVGLLCPLNYSWLWIFMRAAMVGPSAWPSQWFLIFSTCGDCLRSAQSVSSLEHTKDRSAAATVENVGIGLACRPGTVRIHRKTPSTRLEPLGTDRTFTDEVPVEDGVDQHHPTGLCDVRESATCLLDGQGVKGWKSKPF